MRIRVLAPSVLALLLTCLVPSVVAAAEPKFFETTVVEDTDADYAHDALDLVGVYVSEKYQYDSDKREGLETVSFRFHVRNIGGIQCTSTIRYDLHFKLDGAPKDLFASYTTTSPSDRNSCSPIPAGGSGTVSVRATENSLILIMGREALGAPVGSVMTDFYATSGAVVQDQVIGHDVAPADNGNAPSQAVPTTGLKTYTSVGTYPFLTVIPTSPTEQFSVGGAEVEYNFDFIAHPDLRDENIRVRFEFPSGWTISPSQGRTGNDPEGQLTAANGGLARGFSFTLSSSGAAAEGETVGVVMEVITDSGGRLLVPTTTTISGPKIEDPSLNFTLLSPGPFKAEETAQVRFKVANESGPVTAVVSVDLIQNGKRLSTTPLTLADGTYTGAVRFPTEGTYTLDAYLSSLKPSPHQEFVVQAEKGGFAPGAPVWALVAAVVALAALRRRDT